MLKHCNEMLNAIGNVNKNVNENERILCIVWTVRLN